MSNKRKDIPVDLSEFQGAEGMEKLLKLAKQLQQHDGNQKKSKSDGKISTITIPEEGYEEDDDEDESGSEVKAREGCSLAYDSLSLKLVQRENDLNPLFKKDMCFKPEFVHQIFGEEEEIRGYENLQINIFLLSGSLNALIEYSYGKRGAIEQDDFFKMLEESCFTGGFTKKRKEFLLQVKNEVLFKPIVYKANTSKHEGFSNYKKKLSAFAKLFIEVGSFFEDHEDWEYFICYRIDEGGYHTLIGFVNRYAFNFSIEKSRHRISQIVVLPHFQRQGHAQRLLECVYEEAVNDTKCLELTVEDPSLNYQAVRDSIDVRKIQNGRFWKWIHAIKSKSVRGVFQLNGMLCENEEYIRTATKIPKYQIQRVYEILVLSKIDQTNSLVMEQFKAQWMKNTKDKNELKTTKRKTPIIEFDGKQVNVDIQAVLEQKKLMEPNDAYYEELYETSIEQYNQVILKLNL